MIRCCAGLALTVLCLGPAQASPSEDLPPDFVRQLRQALRENPDILLDALRDNSETMLEIVQQGAEQRRRQALARQWQADLQTPKKMDLEGRPSRGPENAPVTLVAFSDFTCTYCRQAAVTVENLLKRYPGRIRFVFKQSPGSDLGRLAARWFLAASAQDSVKAWMFYARLFDRQQRYAADPLPVLREVAGEVGLDARKLEADIAARTKELDGVIEADQADARQLGFAGTPYFLVNNLVIRGALPLEDFIDAVNMAMEGDRVSSEGAREKAPERRE